MVAAEVLLAQVDDLAVDVHHDDSLHGVVGQHLAYGRALAAPGDEHLPGLRVRHHARLYERLVVDELVQRGRLGLAVKHEGASEQRRVLDDHRLVGCPALVDDPLDALALHQLRSYLLVVPPSAAWRPTGSAHRAGDAAGSRAGPRATSLISGREEWRRSTSTSAAFRGCSAAPHVNMSAAA